MKNTFTVVRTPAGNLYPDKIADQKKSEQTVGFFPMGNPTCLLISRSDAASIIKNYRKLKTPIERVVQVRSR